MSSRFYRVPLTNMSLELDPMKYSKGPGLTSQEWDSEFHREKVLSSKVKVTVLDSPG